MHPHCKPTNGTRPPQPPDIPADENAPLSYRVYHEMRSVLRLHKQLLMRKLAEKDTHPGQAITLWALSNHDGLTQGELAHMLSVAQPTVSVMLNKMEQAGLVERRFDADDRRYRRIWLTEAGRALQAELGAVHADVVETTMAGLTQAEQIELMRLLRRIGKNLTTATGERQDG